MALPGINKKIRVVCGDSEITGTGVVEFSDPQGELFMEDGMSAFVKFDKPIQVTMIIKKKNWFVRGLLWCGRIFKG